MESLWLTYTSMRDGPVKACNSELSLGALTGLQRVNFDQVIRFASTSVVLPHLQVEPLQVHGVLFGVEERTAYALLPHTRADLLQAAWSKQCVLGVSLTRLLDVRDVRWKEKRLTIPCLCRAWRQLLHTPAGSEPWVQGSQDRWAGTPLHVTPVSLLHKSSEITLHKAKRHIWWVVIIAGVGGHIIKDAEAGGTNNKKNTLPGMVTIGVPAHSTSMPVVWPLQRGVSRHTSANWPRLTCSSLGATGEKMMREPGRPRFWAYCWMLGSPTAGNRRSHSTLLGTRFRIYTTERSE